MVCAGPAPATLRAPACTAPTPPRPVGCGSMRRRRPCRRRRLTVYHRRPPREREKVREKGQSKDTDKLIRRLSLVALLLSRRGQPVSVAEIRSRVEGYPTMTEEAFKRRFYEDRAELRRLGIEIRSDEDPLSETASELYSLPADAYYLEPVALDGEEIAALAACLAVLEDRFAYSQPLRLALLSLAQGRPELLAEAETPPLTVVPETREPSAALPKLQAAVAERKTVAFDYYAITRDEEMAARRRPLRPAARRRRVVPHRLVPPARGRAHVPSLPHPLRRQVPHTPPHDFAPPEGFDLERLSRPARLAAGRAQRPPRASASRRRWPGGSRRTGRTAARSSGQTTAASCTRPPTPTRGPCSPGCSDSRTRPSCSSPPDLRAAAQRPAGHAWRRCSTRRPRSGRRTPSPPPRHAPRRRKARRRPGASRSTASLASRRWRATSCSAATTRPCSTSPTCAPTSASAPGSCARTSASSTS